MSVVAFAAVFARVSVVEEGASAATPTVTTYKDFNNALNVLVKGGSSKGGTVHWLGAFDDLGTCQSACLSSSTRCWSFVWFSTCAGGPCDCYSVTSPGWNPSYDEGAISGTVQWECRDDDDCSLNGVCRSGKCECRSAWSGHRCQTLATLPARKGAGYRGEDNGHNTSSWGVSGRPLERCV
jgi:hypothetical protein